MGGTNAAIDILKEKLRYDFAQALIRLDNKIQAIYRRGSAEGNLKSGKTFIDVGLECQNLVSAQAKLLLNNTKAAIADGLVSDRDGFDQVLYQCFVDEVLKAPNFADVRLEKTNEIIESDRGMEKIQLEGFRHQEQVADSLLLDLQLLSQGCHAKQKRAREKRVQTIVDNLVVKIIVSLLAAWGAFDLLKLVWARLWA